MSRIDAIDARIVAHARAAVNFVLEFVAGSDDLTEPELQRFDDFLYGVSCVVDSVARDRVDLLSNGLKSASLDLSGWRIDYERTAEGRLADGPSGEHKSVYYTGDSTGRAIMAGRLQAIHDFLAKLSGE